ncbi:MAG: hypothetical protein LBR66_05910 [Candidatus Symbiothrix sp.]|jgi:chromosome segregation ATPase|nr:hypothetical protein [Candidatus Symbiothrix sp.]
MTEEQTKLLYVFENQVHRLMQMCNDLKSENHDLAASIAEWQTKYQELEAELKTIEAKYDNLKTARIIEVKQDDFKGAKDRLSRLVSEVDKCLALLND